MWRDTGLEMQDSVQTDINKYKRKWFLVEGKNAL